MGRPATSKSPPRPRSPTLAPKAPAGELRAFFHHPAVYRNYAGDPFDTVEMRSLSDKLDRLQRQDPLSKFQEHEAALNSYLSGAAQDPEASLATAQDTYALAKICVHTEVPNAAQMFIAAAMKLAKAYHTNKCTQQAVEHAQEAYNAASAVARVNGRDAPANYDDSPRSTSSVPTLAHMAETNVNACARLLSKLLLEFHRVKPSKVHLYAALRHLLSIDPPLPDLISVYQDESLPDAVMDGLQQDVDRALQLGYCYDLLAEDELHMLLTMQARRAELQHSAEKLQVRLEDTKVDSAMHKRLERKIASAHAKINRMQPELTELAVQGAQHFDLAVHVLVCCKDTAESGAGPGGPQGLRVGGHAVGHRVNALLYQAARLDIAACTDDDSETDALQAAQRKLLEVLASKHDSASSLPLDLEAQTLNLLGHVLQELQEHEKAAQRFAELVEVRKQQLAKKPKTCALRVGEAMKLQAAAMVGAGQLAEAASVYTEAKGILGKHLNADHPDLADLSARLASVTKKQFAAQKR